MSVVSRLLDPTLVEHLNHMQLSARSVVEGSTIGQHKSPVKGASVEFRQHRFYVPGDEPRRLDWRVLARTDRPYVKEYDEETNLRCVLMLDVSASMGYGEGGESKIDFATRLAAALAYLMLGQTESVGVAVCGRGVEHYLAPHAGPTQLARVLEMLEQSAPAGESGFDKAMHNVAERMERRGLVIALSDFFMPAERVRSGLAHLRHERHEVVALQVVHADEEEFPFRTWSRFRGLEGERPQLCEPALARQRYLDNFNRHRRAIADSCRALRVTFRRQRTDVGVLDAIRGLLMRRG
jgi:uncharacterized protein (DUF58 family)